MKKILLSVLTVAILAGCQMTKSPTGRNQALMYSATDMAQLGKQSFAEMKEKQKVVSDKRLNAYVNCVAQAIVAQVTPDKAYSDNSGVPGNDQWEVVVFDAEDVNAFALPGGYIGVYSGLLKVADNQNQLAAVLGHEVGHVLANHSNERLSRSQLTNIGMGLANAAFDLSDTDHKDLWMQGLGLGAQYGLILPFGRHQESESDKIGLDLMAKAGFEPQQSITLWQAMDKASGGNSTLEFLSTHPSHETRIADLTAGMNHANALFIAAQASGLQPQCQR